MPDTQTRRFCSLDEDLRQRLQAMGIEQRDMRFEPDPRHPSRWVLSWRPPAEPDFELVAQRAIVARISAERERDLALADFERLEAEFVRRDDVAEERDSLRETASELHRQITKQDARLVELEDCIRELRARNDDYAPSPTGDYSIVQSETRSLVEHLAGELDEISALCAHRDSLEAELRKALASEGEKHAERDRARASAIEWANTPIHRLLAAYNERRQREASPRPGDLQGLSIREGERDWWWIDWAAWTVSFDWTSARCSAGTLDAACTSAAEQIEAA